MELCHNAIIQCSKRIFWIYIIAMEQKLATSEKKTKVIEHFDN